jgi:hypothetical protein
MGTSESKLAQMCQGESGEGQYLDWLANPFTQMFLSTFRERGRPARSTMMTSDAAFMALGESYGWNGAADLIESPRATTPKAGRSLDASYGAGPAPKVK